MVIHVQNEDARFANVSVPRLLHLIDVAGTGGAETVFCQMVRFFGTSGNNAGVIIPTEGWVSEQLDSAGICYEIVPTKGSMSVRLLRSLTKVVRRTGAQVLVAHLLGSGVYASVAGWWSNRQVIAIFHGALDFKRPGRMAWIKRWLLQRQHVNVIAVSSGVRDSLIQWGMSGRNVHVIPNGVDTAAFFPGGTPSLRQRCGIPSDAWVVGCVGNLHPIKGYEHLLQAAAALVRQSLKVHFLIAGDGDAGYRLELQALSASLGLADRVHFLGFQPATRDLYSCMDVFVSSASSEGLPLSFLEAMACGVPIVAIENEGSVPLLLDTEGGLIAEAGRPEAFANAISRLLNSRDLRNQLAVNGRKSVTARYSLSISMNRYMDLARDLISQRVSPSPNR